MSSIKLQSYKRKDSGNLHHNDVISGKSHPGIVMGDVAWTGTEDEKTQKNGNVADDNASHGDIKVIDDDYDDDDEEDNGACSRFIMVIQTAISDFYKKHGIWIWRGIGVVLLKAYFVYFGFAMAYEFGSPGSIQLLWMTIAAVCLYVIFNFHLWSRFTKCCSERGTLSKKTTGIISWTLGLLLLVAVLVFVIIDATVVTKDAYNLVSFSGLFVYVFLVFVTSYNPARVKWRTVLWGINLQLVLALMVLRWHVGFNVLSWISDRVVGLINYTDAGARFVFGPSYREHWFAFSAMSTVVFLSSIIGILFHLGVMWRLTQIIGWVLEKVMGTTAAESMTAAGNIFVGATQSALLVLPLVKDMTKSELHCLMVGGFATVAGNAFGVYMGYGASASHLIAASVMSAPAALALAKLSYPETEKSKTTVADLDQLAKSPYRNIVEAASSGAIMSIKLVANITVNVIAFVAIMEFVNETLQWFGHRVGLFEPELTFGLICSYLMYPLALLMGVELEYCRKVAEILGINTFISTTIAYKLLGDLQSNKAQLSAHIASNQSYAYSGQDIILYDVDGGNTTLIKGILSSRAEAITTYSLCGFGSIDKIGVVLGTLIAIAPERKGDLSALVVRAMIVGNIASFMTACVAGLLFKED